MFSNRLAFAALGLACVAAAAGGGYVATRNNVLEQVASAPASAAETPVAPPASVAVTAPVEQAATPAATATTEPAAEPAAQPARISDRASAAPATVRPAAPARSSSPERSARATRPASEVSAPTRTTARVEPPASREDTVAAPTQPAASADAPAPAPRADERVADVQPSTAATLPAATFDELVVAADSVIGLRTETALSSERARVEDRVEARVVRDVRVGGRVAIPAGTRALGSVVVVERGGRMKERARLGIRFHTLAMADGTRLPISTETIYRYGDAPGDASAKKIGGGAVAGAILGAIIGGGKGAAIGAATGAAGGGAVVMTGERSEAEFPSGADVTARIVSPVTVTLER